ncbi:DUF4421 family protein [Alistipes sp. ZOR0009]|uniref:DUF4421 family protein n=1 Tax=Alistipes sp. ZOR0009 TaxID=1339253 RepID=UPI0006455FC8|nr:DUF4421 family protein [Alistipes sp. ZOR0009]
MRPTFLLLLVLIAMVDCLSAQPSDTLVKRANLYVEKFDTLINIKLSLNNDYEKLESSGKGFYFDIRPNIAVAARVSFDYKFVSFGFGFTPRFLPGNNDTKINGKTTNLSFGTRFQFSHWMQDFEISGIKGFYIANTKNLSPEWKEGDPNIILPDLRIVSLRGMTSYKFNPNFSLKAITSQTEAQRKSCGSFMVSLEYSYHLLDSPGFSGGSDQKQKSYHLIAIGNYGYSFVIRKNFYVSLAQALGVGVAYIRLSTLLPDGDYTVKSYQPLAYGHSSINVGYNGRRVYGGVGSNLIVTSQSQSNSSQIDQSRGYYHFFIGYRFQAPSLFRKTVSKIERYI